MALKRPAIQRIVAIDWSGRVDAAGQRRHIFAGVWTLGQPVRLENGRTREEIADWLIELSRETPCAMSTPQRMHQLSGGTLSTAITRKRGCSMLVQTHASGASRTSGQPSFPARICIACCGRQTSTTN
jgi:hypothetical protein